MQTVLLDQRVGRPADHHTVGGEPFDLIVVDDRAARVVGDDSHRRPAVQAIAADQRAGADDLHMGLVAVGEIVALHPHADVAGDDADAVAGEICCRVFR